MMKKKNISYKTLLIISFLGTFLVHILCNFCVPMIHFNPDELGAISGAAQLAGKDWTTLWGEVQAYYGVVFGSLCTPLFIFIKNPFILYQSLMAVMALGHSLIAPLTFNLLYKYFKIDSLKYCFIGSVGTSFMVAWRASNVMNETPLLLCVWLVFYLILYLEKNPEKKNLGTVLLVIVLAVSYLSHTRAVIIIIATVMTLMVYHIFNKKSLINIRTFFFASILCVIVSYVLLKLIETGVFNVQANGNLHNSLASMGDVLKVNTGEERRASLEGLKGFLDMLLGNTFACGIVTFGTAWIFVGYMLKECWIKGKAFFRREKIHVDTMFYPGFFCVLGLGGSLVAYSILNTTYAMVAKQQGLIISYYLYPRYFGIYFSPIFLLLLVWFYKKKEEKFGIFFFSIILFISSSLYIFVRYIYEDAKAGGDVLDAWRILLPLTFSTDWRKPIYFYHYVWCMLLIIALILLWLFLFKKKKILILVCCLSILSMYQYVIETVIFDSGISKYTYELVDDTYNLLQGNKEVLKKIDTIYIDSEANRRVPYVLQFLFSDKEITVGFPEKNGVVMTTRNPEFIEELLNGDYKTVQAGEEEYLLIKGEKYQKLFEEAGYRLE